MADKPSDDDVRRARAHAQKAKETAEAMAPYVKTNRLNPLLLKSVLDKHAPGNDAEDDGIYDQPWLVTDTFYRHTEEYVPPENRTGYKHALETTFPKKVT